MLRILWERVGWASVISASYVIGYGIFALVPDAPLIGQMLAYLPCWLVGCWLVEQVSHGRTLSGNLLLARVAVIGLGVLVGFAHYAGFISLHWTLPAFGSLVVPWLWLEVSNDVVPAVRVRGRLAHWGRWSYSLYLMHPAVILGITPMLLSPHASRSTYAIVALVLSLLLSFAFYKVVEHPGHRLARRLANAILAGQTGKQHGSSAHRKRAPSSRQSILVDGAAPAGQEIGLGAFRQFQRLLERLAKIRLDQLALDLAGAGNRPRETR